MNSRSDTQNTLKRVVTPLERVLTRFEVAAVEFIRWLWLALVACLAVGLLILAGIPGSATLALAQKEPPAMPMPDRLAPPPMPANPAQADYGAQVYWLVCMACHGDRGQGLTDEWRSAWAPGDQNCWQSKCHASNHPPQGFELPRYAPRIIGEGTLVRFETAAGLYEYLRTQMPWHAPGSLQDDEYWQLTAFLLRANGVLPGQATLGPERAAQVHLRGVPARPSSHLPADFGLHLGRAGVLAGVLLVLVILLLRRRT